MAERPAGLSSINELHRFGASGPEEESRADTRVVGLRDLTEEEGEFCREKISRLLGNARFRKALAAIGDRSPHGKTPLTPETAARLNGSIVPFLAAIAVTKGARRKTWEWERVWSVGTGKEWKALTEFHRRLRKIANDVERINRSPILNPEGWLVDSAVPDAAKGPINAGYIKRHFKLLPATLRWYAAWIEIAAKMIPALTKKNYSPAPRGHSPYVGYVSEMAKLITGRFCDSEVAEVLNAADLVLNPGDSRSGLRFDAQTFRDLRSRQKRKVPRT